MLTSEQRAELDAVMRRRHGSAALARRARCVLLWSDGERRVDIRSKLACNDEHEHEYIVNCLGIEKPETTNGSLANYCSATRDCGDTNTNFCPELP